MRFCSTPRRTVDDMPAALTAGGPGMTLWHGYLQPGICAPAIAETIGISRPISFAQSPEGMAKEIAQIPGLDDLLRPRRECAAAEAAVLTKRHSCVIQRRRAMRHKKTR